MIDIFLSILLSFAITAIIAPLIIDLIKRAKARQNILNYVDNHKAKQGTPTMGGIIFVLSIIISSAVLFRGSVQNALVVLGVFAGYGVIGFLDDFIKIRFNRNLGLRAYQKIIGQTGIALIIALYCYFNINVGSGLIIPFTDITVDIGFFVIPLVVFIMLAATNSVNLTDGLDGLAGGVTFVYMLGFLAVLFLQYTGMSNMGLDLQTLQEYRNIIVICGSVAGAMLAWLIFNSNKASIFMGDTGSLALGGIIAATASVTKTTLYIPMLGIMFVVSTVSVIIQVLHFKRTKKRVFLMAPYHHHLERKGLNESKIVALYMIISFIAAALVLLLTFIFTT